MLAMRERRFLIGSGTPQYPLSVSFSLAYQKHMATYADTLSAMIVRNMRHPMSMSSTGAEVSIIELLILPIISHTPAFFPKLRKSSNSMKNLETAYMYAPSPMIASPASLVRMKYRPNAMSQEPIASPQKIAEMLFMSESLNPL